MILSLTTERWHKYKFRIFDEKLKPINIYFKIYHTLMISLSEILFTVAADG